MPRLAVGGLIHQEADGRHWAAGIGHGSFVGWSLRSVALPVSGWIAVQLLPCANPALGPPRSMPPQLPAAAAARADHHQGGRVRQPPRRAQAPLQVWGGCRSAPAPARERWRGRAATSSLLHPVPSTAQPAHCAVFNCGPRTAPARPPPLGRREQKTSDASREAHRQALLAQAGANAGAVPEAAISAALNMQMVESIPLLHNTRENGHIAVNMCAHARSGPLGAGRWQGAAVPAHALSSPGASSPPKAALVARLRQRCHLFTRLPWHPRCLAGILTTRRASSARPATRARQTSFWPAAAAPWT